MCVRVCQIGTAYVQSNVVALDGVRSAWQYHDRVLMAPPPVSPTGGARVHGVVVVPGRESSPEESHASNAVPSLRVTHNQPTSRQSECRSHALGWSHSGSERTLTMKRWLWAATAALVVLGCSSQQEQAPTGEDATEVTPDAPWDRTQGGAYEWGIGPDGRETVIAVDGEPVPVRYETERTHSIALQAAARGVPYGDVEMEWAQSLTPVAYDLDGDVAVTDAPAGAVAEKASHHPTYQYGMIGEGANIVNNAFRGMSSCTCNGIGGVVGGSLPSSQTVYSCTQANSGRHETPQCLFPQTKTWSYFMGDETTWSGSGRNLTFMRARMTVALFNWKNGVSSSAFTFNEVRSAIPGVMLQFTLTSGSPAYLGRTNLSGTAPDEGDLPPPSGKSTSGKAFSYGFASIDINSPGIEGVSANEQLARHIIPGPNGFDYTNAYENVIAHELGHAMGLPHFTNGAAGTVSGLMVPGCSIAGKDRLVPPVNGGVVGRVDDYTAALQSLKTNSTANIELGLPRNSVTPRALTLASGGGCNSGDPGLSDPDFTGG